ncbi:MAG: HDOD domain-containing protein [Nibricoccus sp.]
MPPASFSLDLPTRPSPEEIAGMLSHLPSAPNVLPRLSELMHEENLSLQDVSRLLRLDPGLTARVLGLGFQRASIRGAQCTTVEDAINLIGLNPIVAMISQVAKAQVLARPVNLYGLDADELWRWSVSCALSAELLAELTGEDKGVAYSAGLLHAAGVVAIDEWALQRAPSLLFMPRDVVSDFTASERALLGCTQAEVGAALLQRWEFPATLVEPIRWQNAPHGSAGYARMACLLNAAKWLRTVVCAEDDFRTPALPDAVVLRPLRFTPERLMRLVVEVRIRLGEVRNLVEALAA